MQEFDDANFQVIAHAIEDGAVRANLNGYAKVIKKRGNNNLRHRNEHTSLVHPNNFSRFTENDIAVTI